jgi:hypothetical protein
MNVARMVDATERSIASSTGTPCALSSSYRASWMIDALIPLPRMIGPRNAVDALRWPNSRSATPSDALTPQIAGTAISGRLRNRP